MRDRYAPENLIIAVAGKDHDTVLRYCQSLLTTEDRKLVEPLDQELSPLDTKPLSLTKSSNSTIYGAEEGCILTMTKVCTIAHKYTFGR